MDLPEAQNAGSNLKKGSWIKRYYLHLAAFLLALLLCVLIIVFRERIAALGGYGYLGAFLVPLLCCASLVVPIPGIIIVFTLGAVLNPLLVGVISGVGATIGEMTGYLVGYGGRSVIENMGLYRRIEGWMRKWAPLPLFFMALVPNPFFDLAGAAAGALRVPLWKFLVYGGAGRIIKHLIIALAGAWGIESIRQFLA